MHLNLTCQKTHILAWLNSDSTLSLKINGVKYLAHSKVDKRGEKYWKVDSLITSNSPPKVPTTKAEIDLILNKPLSEQTKEDREKWAKYIEQEKAQEQITNQSQKVADNLKEKLENHETSPQ